MALTRRLFLGGLFVAAAAPAIVTSKGFRQAICDPRGRIVPLRGQTKSLVVLDEAAWYGTETGRLSATEPAWQELDALNTYPPYQREALKRLLFCQRYGTSDPFLRVPQKTARPRVMVDLDFSRMEQRVLAVRKA
jgi:hypothetical protein